MFAVDAVLASRYNYKRQRRHEIWLFAERFGNFEMLKAATSSAGQFFTSSYKLILFLSFALSIF